MKVIWFAVLLFILIFGYFPNNCNGDGQPNSKSKGVESLYYATTHLKKADAKKFIKFSKDDHYKVTNGNKVKIDGKKFLKFLKSGDEVTSALWLKFAKKYGIIGDDFRPAIQRLYEKGSYKLERIKYQLEHQVQKLSASPEKIAKSTVKKTGRVAYRFEDFVKSNKPTASKVKNRNATACHVQRCSNLLKSVRWCNLCSECWLGSNGLNTENLYQNSNKNNTDIFPQSKR